MNNEVFLKLYNDLENQIERKYASSQYAGSAISFYIRSVVQDEDTKEKLDQIRQIRNFIVHEDSFENYKMIEVEDDVIHFMRHLIYRLINPQSVYDIANKFEQTIHATLTSNVKDIMQQMKQYGYSHIPVVNENQHIVGVFSESTLFSYVLEHDNEVVLRNDTRIQDFKEAILVNRHSSERYEFLKKNIPVLVAVNLFKKYEHDAKKLKMIFLTEDGTMNTKLLGIITPFELFKIKKEEK